MTNKRVGILTMHKVLNYGSALQAYATQHTIETLGYDCELIDYKYPNLEHLAFQGRISQAKDLSLKDILRLMFHQIKVRFRNDVKNRFDDFYSDFFNCSTNVYNNRLEILTNYPVYDIYITGSDQVWNPDYIGFDTNFMLNFAPKGARKISYASSFTISEIPSCLKKTYAESLEDYHMISVRESSGQKIVKELTDKESVVVCDPTLLLDSTYWNKVAKKSKIKIEKPYMLVYLMGYAYNPYPEVYNYIERVNDVLKLPVIYLNAIPGRLKNKYKEINVSNVGPCEFLYIISHAQFVVTDSFHGTAFSLNFGKMFISCIKKRDNIDSRIYDLLKKLKADDHAVVYDKNEPICMDCQTEETKQALEEYRKHSLTYLKKSLK